jgi:hypothetical protein
MNSSNNYVPLTYKQICEIANEGDLAKFRKFFNEFLEMRKVCMISGEPAFSISDNPICMYTTSDQVWNAFFAEICKSNFEDHVNSGNYEEFIKLFLRQTKRLNIYFNTYGLCDTIISLMYLYRDNKCAIELQNIITKILSIQIDCPDKSRIKNEIYNFDLSKRYRKNYL